MKLSLYLCVLASSVAGCGDGGAGADPSVSLDAVATEDALGCVARPGPVAERVRTQSGVLVGVRDGATLAFKRVPFAAPPVGALRYAPPQPPACAREIDASTLGPRCPQLDDDDQFVGDEDCLHLNVWAPEAASAAPRPVMVWIHGGANAVGSAVDPLYDGRRLAEAGDAIVVSFNYRLGQLGFLGHPALGSGQGTFGVLDQIAALAWVRDNIAAFGGDPGNVLLFGESAGGRNVCTLVAAPGAAGLFHRAVIQSGACKFLPTRAAAEQIAAEVATDVGCAGATDLPACLRALPAETLMRSQRGAPGVLSASPFNPMVDGAVIPAQPEATIRAGAHHHMPFAIGANADETGGAAPAITSAAQYEAVVRAQYPTAIADRVLAQYPAAAYPTPRAAYVRLTTDARFVCPSREIARTVDAAQSEPVYRYFFDHAVSPFGAVHGLEIPYLFGTFAALGYTPTAADLALSTAIQGYWTRFARGGVPGGSPAWPAHDASDPALVLAPTPTTAAGIRDADCDFWKPYYDAL